LELAFECLGSRPERYAAAPTLAFRLRIAETTGRDVLAIALRCQLRIWPQRRGYSTAEEARLADLFGGRERWGTTLRPLQFAHVTTMVPAFRGTTEIDLTVPCSYDLEIACGQYFHALDNGEVPLLMLFGGTTFGATEIGAEAGMVPWAAECEYRMPVTVWRELMDRYFPGGGWLRLRRENLDGLRAFKHRRGLPTWDDTIEALLKEGGYGS
jgi:Family of unknown function (DUF6084)